MKQYLINLKQFREERGLLTYNHEAFIKMVTEELDEVLTAKNWNHRVEEMCDVCVLCFNAMAQRGRDCSVVHTAKTMSVYIDVSFAVSSSEAGIDGWHVREAILNMRDCITLNGYDFDKAMLETTKKILSREGAMNESTGKWTKSLTQSKETLYTPNYEACKL